MALVLVKGNVKSDLRWKNRILPELLGLSRSEEDRLGVGGWGGGDLLGKVFVLKQPIIDDKSNCADTSYIYI